MTPRQARQITGLSLVTIYALFGLIRRRMIEAGLFVGWVQLRLSTALWLEYGFERSETLMTVFRERFPDAQPTAVTDAFMHKLIRLTLAKRGIRDENFFEHFAETTYFSSETVNRLPPDTRHQIMLNIIRMTGPLNGPAKNLDSCRRFVNQTMGGGLKRARTHRSIAERQPRR